MPYEIHDDKIVMRAGNYNLPKCCCGEPWRLNTVHREKTPCFSYIEHEWVGLDDIDLAGCGNQDEVSSARYWETKLKEKNT